MKKPKSKILNFHTDQHLRMAILQELRKFSDVDVYCASSMSEVHLLSELVLFDVCICGTSAAAADFSNKIDPEKMKAKIVVLDLKKTIPKINNGKSTHVNSIELLVEVVKKEIKDPLIQIRASHLAVSDEDYQDKKLINQKRTKI